MRKNVTQSYSKQQQQKRKLYSYQQNQLQLCNNNNFTFLRLVIHYCLVLSSLAFVLQKPLRSIERSVVLLNKVNNITNQEVTTGDDIRASNNKKSWFPWNTLRKRSTRSIREVRTLEELEDAFREAKRCGDASLKYTVVRGDTQKVGSPDNKEFLHPVLQLLHERRRRRCHSFSDSDNTTTMIDDDGYKVALAIEGGGMRGCVSAGMVAAIYYLNLEDTFDVVYGSSAGSLIGAYFITRQLPWFGPEIYYDILTTAGRRFIDTRRIVRALGLGLLDPRLWRDVITRRNHGKPVLQLSYLLEEAVQRLKPLNWTKFVSMQRRQPLKIVASGLKSEKAIVFDMMETESFTTVEELTFCMHASMLLPGIAGPMMNIGRKNEKLQQILRNNHGDDFEPLMDALVYEPLPYRSAISEGATHVVVLRTKPDGVDVLGNPSLLERLLLRRFFLRKNTLPNIYRRMRRQEHKRLYANDVIVLNDAVNYDTRDYTDTTSPHLLPIALPPGSPEISRLETGRDEILLGVRRGFARAYDALVLDPKERGRGMAVAMKCFPDTILQYDPLEILANTTNKGSSAFEVYMRSCYPHSEESLENAARAIYKE